MFKRDRVEEVCKNLSPLFKQAIKKNILDLAPSDSYYTFGEALIFWTADFLVTTKLLQPEQLRAAIEEFAGELQMFGSLLAGFRSQTNIKNVKLPSCKLGVLDRKLICMDGKKVFLDITTGATMPAINKNPLETISYNLTVLAFRYARACDGKETTDLKPVVKEQKA